MTQAKGAAAPDSLATDFERAKKFVEYLQESAKRGDRADDAQLHSLGMAKTPCRTLYTEGSARVLAYDVLAAGDPFPIPIVMIYSFINRWYILDLMPEHSFIEALSRAGFQVYLVDWGIPGPEHAGLDLNYYLETVALRAVNRIRRLHHGVPVTLFGYCMGGTLAGMMAALHPEHYANQVLLTTPFSFEEAGLLSLWTNKEYFDPDKVTKAFGCIPEKFLHASFPFMQPKNSLAKPRMLFDNILNDEYLKNFTSLDRWATDNVPFPGLVFKQFLKDCYQENALARGEMRIGSQRVDLSRITCPTLNIFGTQDHIVPPQAAKRNTAVLSGCSCTNREYGAGHLTLTVAHPVRHTVWNDTVAWLLDPANIRRH